MNLFDVYPLFDIHPVKAQGSWLWDDKGNKYLDLYGGHAVISVGHSHPYYVDMLTRQLNQIAFYSNSVKIGLQEELADKLGKQSGYTGYQLFLCNSGAEANENALKLASFHTGRKKIIAFDKSFHGRTSLAVAATDDASLSAPINANAYIQFLPFNDEAALEKAMSSEICAVIVEGIQGVGGVRIASTSFLKKAKALCEKFGAVLILDEVQSGYGRSGQFFAHQHAGIQADLITVAKGMGNGFPVAGVLIAPVFKAKHGMLGTTFGGNYLACAAGIAVLDILEKEKLCENAALQGKYLMDELKKLPGIKEVRGEGLMIGIELEQPCAPIRKSLLDKHYIFTGSSSSKNTLRILPALNIGKAELDLFLNAFKQELSLTLIPK
ncbi:MAG TPA: aminotransferase class III-fold pyridoxal phosphate-dependent enzyme [Bacteroidia bacterium]|jgi:acetylornithine/N-succinyldiaminopimelate aminotransferase|nr:aminotransferase class III-fold pyridoxal phosphate-dependent enzyme [Bacteroidia bacterium]